MCSYTYIYIHILFSIPRPDALDININCFHHNRYRGDCILTNEHDGGRLLDSQKTWENCSRPKYRWHWHRNSILYHLDFSECFISNLIKLVAS